ncbi:hypothetical protein SCLCIDRAFT_692524 [Scleroderma citrinum Foug A]|uniref:Uncharacterized protein n=1 Tax=Scleroderma citrinum Foug A TaxID=1036808 RepID=A0A0C2ZDI2_9AGAM|nr:hypothetical protein SCLCIDRAFT_692524 [Scleroderma citrinum Foug A]
MVLVTLSNAPRVGNVALEITEKELYLKFLLARKDLGRFMETLRRRGVGKLNFVCSALKSSRRSISIASGVNFTNSSSLLEPRPDFEVIIF